MGSDGDHRRAAELTASWLASVLVRWARDGEVSVLAGPAAGPLPGSGPLHVLTSQDPGGEPQPPERNAALLAHLLRWADADLDPARWWLVTGCDPDTGHAEQGIAVAGLDRTTAAAHGARWGQLAIYELTDLDLVVVPCAPDVGDRSALDRVPRRWPDGAPPVRLDGLPLARWWGAYAAALAAARVDYSGGTLAT
jgi:hypothetical protein